MDINILSKRIKEKAEKRFEELYSEACLALQKNLLLSEIKINKENGEYFYLTSTMGYCPATTLFVSDRNLLIKNSKFNEIKEKIINDFIGEETDKILNQIAIMQEYINQ